jgi:hypothetical protein
MGTLNEDKYTFSDHISPNSSETYVEEKNLYRKSKHTFYIQ